MKILLFILFFFNLLNAENLIGIAEKIFPHKKIIVDTLKFTDLSTIFFNKIQLEYDFKDLQNTIKGIDYTIKSIENSFVPRLHFNGFSNYLDVKDRMVSVYSKVPVEWDNENPQQIDINLPNGGHGILWLPKPIKYDWKYIDVHGSREYEAKSSGFSFKINHTYHSGISLDILNLSLNKKYLPDAHGFSWYSTMSNSLNIPLLDIFESKFSPDEIEIKNLQNQKNNIKISLTDMQNRQIINLLNNYLDIYQNWKEIELYQNLKKIVKIQIKDIDILYEKKMITTTEKFTVDNEYQNLLEYENQLYYNIIKNSENINIENNLFHIYYAQIENLSVLIEIMEDKCLSFTQDSSLINILSNNPSFQINKNLLTGKKAEIDLVLKKRRPSLNLSGSLDIFVSNDLGYQEPYQAVKYLIENPDGYNFNIALNFSMPISYIAEDYHLQAVKEQYKSQMEKLKYIKDNILKQKKNYEINSFMLKADIGRATRIYDYSKQNYQKAEQLYQKQRINNYDFLAYKKELLKNDFLLIDSQIKYLKLLIEFYYFLSADSENIFQESSY